MERLDYYYYYYYYYYSKYNLFNNYLESFNFLGEPISDFKGKYKKAHFDQFLPIFRLKMTTEWMEN